MMKKSTIIIVALLLLAIAALAILYAGTHPVAVLDPKGLISLKQRRLFVISSLLMLIVVIPVMIMALVITWKYGTGNKKSKYSPDWGHSNLAEVLWWGVPFCIIIILAVITWQTSHELNPFKPIATNKKPLTIQVVALQWKWLFIYPEQGIATVNFVQFPEKTPLNFEISADAPMNSFWIPQLGGQIYAMPAMRTKLHLIAHEVGQFRGSSANFSGKGFAGMHFMAKSSTDSDFDKWVATVKSSGKTLTFSSYTQLVPPTESVPVTYYRLQDPQLFDKIIMQYTQPSGVHH